MKKACAVPRNNRGSPKCCTARRYLTIFGGEFEGVAFSWEQPRQRGLWCQTGLALTYLDCLPGAGRGPSFGQVRTELKLDPGLRRGDTVYQVFRCVKIKFISPINQPNFLK
jgi:hypothetical protein